MTEAHFLCKVAAASAIFAALVGWQPSAYTPAVPTVADAEARCDGVPFHTRAPELVLQRKRFAPQTQSTLLPPSHDAVSLRAELERVAAAPCRWPLLRPHLPQQELHLGALLHALVPLLWLGLNSTATTSPAVQLPALVSISPRDARCPSQSLGCFVRPLSRCPPAPPGSAARDSAADSKGRAARSKPGKGRGKGGKGKGRGNGKGGRGKGF